MCIVSSLDVGGAETFMMKLFRVLYAKCKFDFIVSKDNGVYEAEVESLGGKIYRVPLRTKHPIETFKKIEKIVKSNGYKKVLKLCDTPMGFFDLLAAKIGGADRVCVRSCNAYSEESKLQHIIYAILRPLFNNTANLKIAPSKLAAEYTFGKNAVEQKDVYFLHNAIDLKKYSYQEQGREKIRKEFNLLPTQLIVGHIGRFNYQKNHDFLLEIFADIIQKRPDAILFLVGEGEKKQDLVKKAEKLGLEKSVIFAGIRMDIPEVLSAMDIFIFPSFYEGMPNTIIEAQACGLPCVLSDSITKEAKITELLTYISLDENSKIWCDVALEKVSQYRKDTKENLSLAGYDIEKVSLEFLGLFFNEGV